MSDKKFGFTSTADDVIGTQNLKGRTVLVTGGNSGLGKETARAFAKANAHVVITCRDEKAGQEAVKDIKKAHPDSSVEVMSLDLASLDSVRAFVQQFKNKKLPINYLILNAGIMAPKKRYTTKEGFEAQFGVNHLGHFLLTTLLIDQLKAGAPSRVVAVSGGEAILHPIRWHDMQWEADWHKWNAYGQSKTANILFAQELNRRMVEQKLDISAFSLHPGVIHTNLARDCLPEDFEMFKEHKITYKSIPQGAATSVFCAVSPTLDKKGGLYFIDCEEASLPSYATDSRHALRLWELSEKMVAAGRPIQAAQFGPAE